MDRRTFLGAACGGATATIAGCSALRVWEADDEPPPHSPAPENATIEAESTENYLTHTHSATVELDVGEYTAQAVSRTSVMDVDCEWETDGTPLDVYCLRPSEYEDTWRDRGSDLRPIAALTRTGRASAHVSEHLDAGTYYFVFDNTGVYGTAPEGPTVVEYLVAASIGDAGP